MVTFTYESTGKKLCLQKKGLYGRIKRQKMAQNLRLQVALAQLGFASRRGAVEIIKAGRVKVNGQVIRRPGYRVNLPNLCPTPARKAGICAAGELGLEKDTITIDDRSSYIQKKVYFMLNKPKGVITTVMDRYAGRCATDLIRQKDVRIYPVGRLDKDTTGVLLLTNDGALAYRLSHPKFGIKRVYRVCVKGDVCQKTAKKLESGIFLEGKKTFPCRIKIISKTSSVRDRRLSNGASHTTRLEIQLTEGRKRQIKKMFAAFGHPVLAIERIAFGPLKLANLKVGRWRPLKVQEIAELNEASR